MHKSVSTTLSHNFWTIRNSSKRLYTNQLIRVYRVLGVSSIFRKSELLGKEGEKNELNMFQ